MVEERRTRLDAAVHRHVVDALDRIVDEHHLAVQAQRAIDRRRGAGRGEAALDELARGVEVEPQTRVDRGARLGVRAIDELGDVLVGAGTRRVGERLIPGVACKDLVGALPRLHDLDVARDLLAEQVKRDAVVRDHRLAHRGDRRVDRRHACGASTSIRVCAVPNSAATRSEYSNSSPLTPFAPSKPIEKVASSR